MRYLWYTNYQHGRVGLSNSLMSIENGVILAFLTNRFLLLEGNISPPANIVAYDGRVTNELPSRISDLIDFPVPWANLGEVDIEGIKGTELTDRHLMHSIFYLPGTVDIHSADALSFANGRTNWLCEDDELAALPLLKLTEEPMEPKDNRNRDNLSFYSYFFYLDPETRRSVKQMLLRMKAKAPYAELAQKVAADLGKFNVVHLRRGDFKVTYGVTILDRQPWEVIESLDHHFSRSDRLVILTDERDDPFFDEIKAAYTDHIFIDHHILDHYEKDFFALPTYDSIALAHLSQLIAGESEDFVGTMTSTFTSMVQRYRGNRGKHEPFKFLWNELPAPGERLERGRHPVSDCVPLDRGVMIEERNGPYSWSRVSPLLNPAWMREWPESFLTDEELIQSNRLDSPSESAESNPLRRENQFAYIRFEGFQISVKCEIEGLAFRLKEYFGSSRESANTIIDELTIRQHESHFEIYRGKDLVDEGVLEGNTSERFLDIAQALVNVLVAKLALARKHYSWLRGKTFSKNGRSILLCGDTGEGANNLPDALCRSGWELVADQIAPVRQGQSDDRVEMVPLVRCLWPEGASARIEFKPVAIHAVVFCALYLHSRIHFVPLAGAVGAAELIRYSEDFKIDRTMATQRICKLAEQLNTYQLNFSQADSVPALLENLS